MSETHTDTFSEEKKLKIMSLSVDPDMHKLLKDSARRLGHRNVSQLVRDLITKYLPLMTNMEEEIPVILRIPSDYRDDPEKLKQWLSAKVDAIVEALS